MVLLIFYVSAGAHTYIYVLIQPLGYGIWALDLGTF
jgi:hypothetical protein